MLKYKVNTFPFSALLLGDDSMLAEDIDADSCMESSKPLFNFSRNKLHNISHVGACTLHV